MFSEIVIVLALVLLNGVFAGAEIAIISLRKTRVQELLDEGGQAAQAVAALRANPERFLATVQIGITVVGATAAAFSGSSIAERLAPAFARIPAFATWADDLALAVVVVGISYLTLVMGELVPKSLALRAAEPYALFIGRPLRALAWIARPVVWSLTASSNGVLRWFGDQTSFSESRLSMDELLQLVDEAAEAGSVGEHAGEIAARALRFDALDAASVMVPRNRIVGIETTATVADLASLARARGHARVLVHGGQRDEVVGYVVVRDVLAAAIRHPEGSIAPYILDVPFVPETAPCSGVLQQLQRDRTHLAAVIDEQGGLRGIITIEDLVEELVGEIMSENEPAPEPLAVEADGSASVDAALSVHGVNRALGVALPEGGSFTTIAGLILDLAGRIPAVGETFEAGAYVLEVERSSPRRVERVRIRAKA